MPSSRIACTRMRRRRLVVHRAEARRQHAEIRRARSTARRKSPSAIGLRQTLPVQINRMVFMPRKVQGESRTANRQPERFNLIIAAIVIAIGFCLCLQDQEPDGDQG